MTSIEELDALWADYQSARDAMRVARHALDRPDADLLHHTSYAGQGRDMAVPALQRAQESTERAHLVILWAHFEQALQAFVRDRVGAALDQSNDPVFPPLSEPVLARLDRWQSDRLVAAFQPWVDAQLLEQVNQIRRYRNWLAHKDRQPPPAISADMAYRILRAFLAQLPEEVSVPA